MKPKVFILLILYSVSALKVIKLTMYFIIHELLGIFKIRCYVAAKDAHVNNNTLRTDCSSKLLSGKPSDRSSFLLA